MLEYIGDIIGYSFQWWLEIIAPFIELSAVFGMFGFFCLVTLFWILRRGYQDHGRVWFHEGLEIFPAVGVGTLGVLIFFVASLIVWVPLISLVVFGALSLLGKLVKLSVGEKR